ncbi:MAG: zinc ribbon domain-containing protein [Candidatus Bathyarchaeia archaeon]
MKTQVVRYLFLMLILSLSYSSLLAYISSENVYTTTVTEYLTTTITTTRTETIDIPITSTFTRISTLEIPVTTSGTILVWRTVLVPTTIRTSFIYTTTASYLSCTKILVTYPYITATIPACTIIYEIHTVAGGAILRTYVPEVVQEQFTITSKTTIFNTVTETLETVILQKSTRTMEEPIILTMENVYTSYVTHPSTPTSEQQPGYNIVSLISNNLAWFLIIILMALIIVLIARKRRPAFKPSGKMMYCINCGAQIPSDIKYCPHCGASQKEEKK